MYWTCFALPLHQVKNITFKCATLIREITSHVIWMRKLCGQSLYSLLMNQAISYTLYSIKVGPYPSWYAMGNHALVAPPPRGSSTAFNTVYLHETQD